MSLFSLPSTWTTQEAWLWIFRVLGALTFLAWPGVLIAGIMSAAGHAAKETPFTTLFRFLALASIAYPILFILLWKFADTLKTSKPVFALLLTALPAVFVYGAIGVYQVKYAVSRNAVRANNEALKTQIREALKQENYGVAFDPFLNPARSNEIYLLEESQKPGFDFKTLVVEALDGKAPSVSLVEHLLAYVGSNIAGVTSVHRAYLDPKNSIESVDESAEILALLQKWKQAGLKIQNLPYAFQWQWSHLELFQKAPKVRTQASVKLESENAMLREFQNSFDQPEFLEAIVAKHPGELLNRRGAIFGTPLHALALDHLLGPSEMTKTRIRTLKRLGAKLDETERAPEIIKVVDSIE